VSSGQSPLHGVQDFSVSPCSEAWPVSCNVRGDARMKSRSQTLSPLVRTSRIPGFRILRCLAEGGFTNVLTALEHLRHFSSLGGNGARIRTSGSAPGSMDFRHCRLPASGIQSNHPVVYMGSVLSCPPAFRSQDAGFTRCPISSSLPGNVCWQESNKRDKILKRPCPGP